MGSKILCEYDNLEEDSDQERGIDSSDDDIDVILHGTPKQKRRLSRSLSEGSLDVLSSADEFEKEMELELEETMKQHKSQLQGPPSGTQSITSSTNPTTSTATTSNSDRQYYDKVYFDSDEEDGEGATNGPKITARSKKRQLVQSNDDLFYDPQIDDENQKWVDNQRSCYYPSQLVETRGRQSDSEGGGARGEGGPEAESSAQQEKEHKSDAVLNCPACMTTLCLDCQRHEIYPTQYRAMFVLNCEIVRSEKLRYKPGQKRKKGRWKKKAKGTTTEGGGGGPADGEGGEEGEEVYHPVRCAECNTEVGVFDTDEVYHFFNVLVGIA